VKKIIVKCVLVSVLGAAGQICAQSSAPEKPMVKPVIYQMFTRLFGNTTTTNKPWGTIEENGVGKFNDINDAALEGIKELGATHVWYTGVLHHAVIRDYTAYGITNDDPDVVKGRAGSPYAVKDYYSVDPDLAADPGKRMQEFQALIARTHQHGLKVVIDIVPNHIARQYHSLNNPAGQEDFGARDDKTLEYARNNNFYYVVGEDFKVPAATVGYKPLGGEAHPLADGKFVESPAKWTGNGSRKAQPAADDWYETVKLNYGIRPDGSKDFVALPAEYAKRDLQAHAQFWRDKDVPDTWKKFRAIAEFWLGQGVDGFRFDMAEMVPVEFWSYLNSAIKSKNPNAILIAEVYTPSEYRNYIQLGKMDYLYDKVEMYDSLKAIMQNKGSTHAIASIQDSMADIEEHMLHFLENHDEQRIASPEFAGDPLKAKPAMVVSATVSRSPTMLYFGQEVGEPGAGNAGFGQASRTTIFDYWGVPEHQRWVNGGKYDGGKLSKQQRELREFYARLLGISATSPAMGGAYQQLHSLNVSTAMSGVPAAKPAKAYGDKNFAFARWQAEPGGQKLIIVSNFSSSQANDFVLRLPADLLQKWALQDGRYKLRDKLSASPATYSLKVAEGQGAIAIKLSPLQSVILELVQ
jgi:glycosidase